MDLENRDPLPPPGDCLKTGENMGPFCPLGEKPGWGGFCSQVCSSQRWGRVLHIGPALEGTLLPHPSHTESSAFFIGAVGWVSVSWGPDSGAVSWRWVLAVHEGRAADWGCWGPLSPVPHCSLLFGCSAAPDTQSGHSGTPGENRKDQ